MIPESLLIEVQKFKTAKEVWDMLCAKHGKKALTVVVDICCCIYELKCENKSQVCMHLETLARMQEQLVGMGAGLPDTDLVTIILISLPKSYRPLINAISLPATHAKVSLIPEKVIESLLDEFKRLGIKE